MISLYVNVFKDSTVVFKRFFATMCAVAVALPAMAQTETQELSSEDMLTKYTNARAMCARITDPFVLYERGMLLLGDANDDAYLAAAECFMGAAVRNHTESQVELGNLYEMGNGVQKNDIFAYKWYQTAVLLGNKNAVAYRDNLEKKISLDDITAALPMVQKTLTLIESYTAKQEAELKDEEAKIAKLYLEKFNINLADYEVKEIETTTKKQNFLIDTLTSDQNASENEQGGNRPRPSRRRRLNK